MKYLLAFCLFISVLPSRAQNLGGIGAQLILDTTGGTTMPRILALVPGTPADSNLKATDYIYTVNGTSCKDKTIEEVVGLIRGEIGTTVKITVADTKDGKRPRHYELTRRGVQGVTNQPPPDPVVAFNQWCEKEVQQLGVKGRTIVKTFSSTCAAQRYFNFEAGARTYQVQVMTLEAHTAGVNFTTSVRAFDNDDEAGATAMTTKDHKQVGELDISVTAGEVTFKKSCIGAVNVKVDGDVTRCHGVYVVIYR